MIERAAAALWKSRDERFPKFTRQKWEDGTVLARAAALLDAHAVIESLAEYAFIPPAREEGDSDAGYQGRVVIAFGEWCPKFHAKTLNSQGE